MEVEEGVEQEEYWKFWLRVIGNLFLCSFC